MFVDFFGVCMDQIFDQGAKLRYMFGGKASCPLVIRTTIGAGMGAAGQHWCSAATDIAALVVEKAFTELDAPIKRVTAPHTPVPFSPPLEQFYVPSPERIVAAIQEILG